MKNKYRFALIILLVIFWQGNSLHGQLVKSDDENLEFHSMILPGSLNIWETKTSLSVLFTHLPYDWVEIAVQVPLFQITNKIRFPKGFTLESHFQSIIISNQLRVGPHFYFDVGKFSVGAGFDNEFMFGKMQIAGFNNKSRGWSMYPNFNKQKDWLLEIPQFGDNSILVGTTALTDNCKYSLEGIYKVIDGIGFFGDTVVLKQTSDKISLFGYKNISYFILNAGQKNSEILFEGYWRFAIKMKQG